MKPNRRSNQRIKPRNLRADVLPSAAKPHEKSVDAHIIDISKSGIRIKVDSPMQCEIGDYIKITMSLPDSGNPFTIHGKITRQPDHSELGIQYTGFQDRSIDDMLFECIKLDDLFLLIKNQS